MAIYRFPFRIVIFHSYVKNYRRVYTQAWYPLVTSQGKYHPLQCHLRQSIKGWACSPTHIEQEFSPGFTWKPSEYRDIVPLLSFIVAQKMRLGNWEVPSMDKVGLHQSRADISIKDYRRTLTQGRHGDRPALLCGSAWGASCSLAGWLYLTSRYSENPPKPLVRQCQFQFNKSVFKHGHNMGYPNILH